MNAALAFWMNAWLTYDSEIVDSYDYKQMQRLSTEEAFKV